MKEFFVVEWIQNIIELNSVKSNGYFNLKRTPELYFRNRLDWSFREIWHNHELNYFNSILNASFRELYCNCKVPMIYEIHGLPNNCFFSCQLPRNYFIQTFVRFEIYSLCSNDSAKKNGSYTRFRPKRRLQLNLKQKVRSYRIVDSPGVSNFLDKFKFTDYERESFACERIEGYINSFISTVFHLWITSSFWTFKFVEQIDFPLRQIYMESKERKSKWINFAICLQLQISII